MKTHTNNGTGSIDQYENLASVLAIFQEYGKYEPCETNAIFNPVVTRFIDKLVLAGKVKLEIEESEYSILGLKYIYTVVDTEFFKPKTGEQS